MPTALITGASRGIGLEFVRQYAAEGWQVVATCRDPGRAGPLHQLAAEQPGIRIEKLEVTDWPCIEALAERMKHTPVDLLINNAGVASGAGNRDDGAQIFGGIDPEAWDRVLRINAIAPVMVAQSFIPHLRAGKERKIVMISSMMGSIASCTGNGAVIAYRSSKAALNMAMKCVSLSLRDSGVTAVSLHPGWVKTDMGGKDAEITVETSVTGMRKLIAMLSPADTGRFLGYDGREWPW